MQKIRISLCYNPTMSATTRPYFLWDYDLTEGDVHTLLQSGDDETKIWLTARILESARYEDVWRYLSLADVRTRFPHLKLKQPVRDVWAYALHVWETTASNGS
jgi:hypothetical protein